MICIKVLIWKKYNDDNITYFIGHLHESFDVNKVGGISGDYIEDDWTLTNIVVVDRCGCTKDEYTSYMILEVSKSIKYQKRTIKYDIDKKKWGEEWLLVRSDK